VVYVVTSSTKAGHVISQSVKAGRSVEEGTKVTIKVAKAPPPPTTNPPPQNCTAGYSPCLPPASDYDCAGGSGNGPAYTEPGVTYRVTGSDPYGLDSDNDGYGCE
jgi:beta-lactam-binding protein with PASTA domain